MTHESKNFDDREGQMIALSGIVCGIIIAIWFVWDQIHPNQLTDQELHKRQMDWEEKRNAGWRNDRDQ